MNNPLKLIPAVALIVAVAGSGQAQGDIKLPAIFSDDMILQREMPVPVWGTANPGEIVTVSFAGQSVSGKADAKGQWLLKLGPLETSRDKQTLTIKGTNEISLKNVLVGEVWLCSGQSNMAGTFTESKGRR
ncbi:MAG: hypothetical protein P8H96_13245, partial [Akkermansiaceae bacterium]|nr:hypothetical protein [Akkermansiaceae bacterium]